MLILPGDPLFNATLAMSPPPDVQGSNEIGFKAYVIGIDGIPRAANTQAELDDYLYGGEYGEVIYEADEEALGELIELFL